jgi:hypothetical protein
MFVIIPHMIQRWDQSGEVEQIRRRYHVQIKQEWMSSELPVSF